MVLEKLSCDEASVTSFFFKCPQRATKTKNSKGQRLNVCNAAEEDESAEFDILKSNTEYFLAYESLEFPTSKLNLSLNHESH